MPTDNAVLKTMMTATANGPAQGDVVQSVSGGAAVEIVTMHWYTQVGVRVLRTYLQSLLGFLLATSSGAADAVGLHLPATEFGGVLLQSASLALAPALVALIQNAIEILARLDTAAPKLRG